MSRTSANKVSGAAPRYDGIGSELEEKVIIAIDFGTTFSGVAYCFPNQAATKVASVINWPGENGASHNAPKIPTLISYSQGTVSAWGASVGSASDGIVGIKLLLDHTQERPSYLPTGNTKGDLKMLPKAPYLIAADFIKAVYQYALTELAKEVPASYMALCKKEFVFSVPAVWSDAAKNATLQAAEIAGLSPVTLIKEPEAAATYTLHDLSFSLQAGDTFVICDAGGGTVDLISYEVISKAPKVKLRELVPGTGGMAGSLGLNKRFEEAVKNLIGETELTRIKTTKAWVRANAQFDSEIKTSFRGNASEEYYVHFLMANLQDNLNRGLESNCWTMKGEDVEDIFRPLIADVLTLIDDQVKAVRTKCPNKGVTGIFLVGGFGGSQYLRMCVEKVHPGVQVLQPHDAWSAIVKGAALSKLPDMATVESTKATWHYGVSCNSIYDPSLDYGEKISTDRDGTVRVEIFDWYIKIDDDLHRDQTIKFPFSRDIDVDYRPDDLVFTENLYQSRDPILPRHMSKSRALQVNCKMTTDFNNVPKRMLKKRRDKKGNLYYEIYYDLVIKLESALMTFSCEVDGEPMGSVEANYQD